MLSELSKTLCVGLEDQSIRTAREKKGVEPMTNSVVFGRKLDRPWLSPSGTAEGHFRVH